MKKLLSSLGLLLLTSLSFAEAPFVGTYHCNGIDPYLNQNYEGTITISQQNTVYNLIMKYNTGELYKGTGGQYDETLLSVVFQDSKDKDRVGLEQYHFNKDHTAIEGYWVYLGKDKLGKEICKKA